MARRGQLGCPPGQHELGSPALFSLHLNFTEGKGAEANTQSFHYRLLSGEARRQRRRRICERASIGALARREEALGYLRPPAEDLGEPVHVDQVDAEADE